MKYLFTKEVLVLFLSILLLAGVAFVYLGEDEESVPTTIVEETQQTPPKTESDVSEVVEEGTKEEESEPKQFNEWGYEIFTEPWIQNKVCNIFPGEKEVLFMAQNEESGNIAYIEADKGECGTMREVGYYYLERLVLVTQDGKKVVNPPYNGLIFRKALNISPQGGYVAYNLHGYEWTEPQIANMKTGEVITDVFKDTSFDLKNIIWDEDERYIVIKSTLNDFGGEGFEGIIASEYENPDVLKTAIRIPDEQHSKEGIQVHNLEVSDAIITFRVGPCKERYQLETICDESEAEIYTYNIRTEELTKIEN